MKERQILFSSPMVRAILDGSKTQTRRVIRADWWRCLDPDDDDDRAKAAIVGPHGSTGDRLWVRETWCIAHPDSWDAGPDAAIGRPLGPQCPDGTRQFAWYAATDPDVVNSDDDNRGPWKPSIYMPRWASRITLEITAVRVQRLQEISEDDARAEGCVCDDEPFDHTRQSCADVGCLGKTHRSSFCTLWDSINAKRAPWSSNPWVWALTFRRIP